MNTCSNSYDGNNNNSMSPLYPPKADLKSTNRDACQFRLFLAGKENDPACFAPSHNPEKILYNMSETKGEEIR